MNRISLETKDATDEQLAVITELCKENSKSTVLKMLIDAYIEKQNRKTGIRQETLDNIDKVVKKQMELNATTQKTITVGKGHNAIEVKFEQRAITPKWIMNAAECNQKSALDYIKLHENEINEHHEKVLGIKGKITTDFFNRRTGRATGQNATNTTGQVTTGQSATNTTGQVTTGQSATNTTGQVTTGQNATNTTGQVTTGQVTTGQSATNTTGHCG